MKFSNKIKAAYLIIKKVNWTIFKTEAKNVMQTAWPDFSAFYVRPLCWLVTLCDINLVWVPWLPGLSSVTWEK